jgi:hypothetical protein
VKSVAAICVLSLATLAATGSGRAEIPATAPVVVTGTAQAGDWFAFLHGSVDPGGLETRAWFEWGLTPALGSSTSVQVVSPGSQVTLTDTIIGLESFTTYYFRIVAMNASGPGVGETVRFGTLDTVPPPPARCAVPRVVGKSLATARTRIQRAGCRVGSIRRARSARRKGTVLSQDPTAGARVALQSRVRLVVSRGRR